VRRLHAFGAIIAMLLPTSLTVASPAPAAAANTVWVDVHANSAWPVSRAVSIVDTYTGTKLRVGRCRSGVRCIVIREDRSLPWSWAAATYPGHPVTKIKLNPSRRSSPYAQRLHTLLHELAHARGVYIHNGRCTSVMYHAMRCPDGRVAPNTFTAAERRTLRRN
jgi:hypothetical protein